MATEHSAGGVLFTYHHGRRLYTVVTELDGHVGLPKGHVEPGETERMTALRELREETGIRAALYPDICFEECYPLPHGGDKHVTYFLAVFNRQTITVSQVHVRDAQLLPLDEALKRLTFEGARRILREADDTLNAMAAAEHNK